MKAGGNAEYISRSLAAIHLRAASLSARLIMRTKASSPQTLPLLNPKMAATARSSCKRLM